MNTLLAVAAATLLTAGPFPDPRQISVTDALRCDWGTVNKIDPNGTELTIRSQAGAVTFQINRDVQTFDTKGQTIAITDIRVGDQIRVYFEVRNGAVAREVDKI